MGPKDETDADLARRFALQTVEDALRDLAANILRTIRGGGRPHTILPQVQVLMESALSYREQVGQFPAPDDLGQALEIDIPAERLDQMALRPSLSTQKRAKASRIWKPRSKRVARDWPLRSPRLAPPGGKVGLLDANDRQPRSQHARAAPAGSTSARL